MACHQCGRPGFFDLQNGAELCITCGDVYQSILDRRFIQNAAMMNHCMDSIDAVVGFSAGSGGRIPVSAIARSISRSPTLQNIVISNSTVGVLNTGDLAKIDAAITMTKGSDVDDIGGLLQKLTQAIVDAAEFEPAKKQDLVDLLQSLSSELVQRRKPSVMQALLSSITQRVKGVAAVTTIVDALVRAISGLSGT